MPIKTFLSYLQNTAMLLSCGFIILFRMNSGNTFSTMQFACAIFPLFQAIYDGYSKKKPHRELRSVYLLNLRIKLMDLVAIDMVYYHLHVVFEMKIRLNI
ncbi:hypothetical protein BY458DRAFT_518886 [Sporodiniella umbellata]|nr:hypothetical protein BY458DRAFT_518886 [Sporodiniella umbellata]